MNEEKELRENEATPSKISRREFLKDAGLIVGGAAVGSMALANACGGGEETTKTVTNTSTLTKTTTVTAPGGTAVTTVTVTAAPPASAAAENTINLTVNGHPYVVLVESEWTLQKLLHEKLGFISTKTMCGGLGQCGSCSVIMDGRPILSCMKLAIECDGANIETAEGIAESKHPLIEAYIMNHCMQCGYCTPGFVVTAKALLDHNPKPTEADIREALGGNVCRCGTYPAHIAAILEVAGS